MSIPTPDAGGAKEEEYESVCEMYDGGKETAGICSFWITKTQKCTNGGVPDDLRENCDGCGNFPDKVEAKYS